MGLLKLLGIDQTKNDKIKKNKATVKNDGRILIIKSKINNQ